MSDRVKLLIFTVPVVLRPIRPIGRIGRRPIGRKNNRPICIADFVASNETGYHFQPLFPY